MSGRQQMEKSEWK